MGFDESVLVVIAHEGGYVNDPDDNGHATNHGITQETLSNFRGAIVTREEVKALTSDEAKLIYKKLYWDPMMLDQVQDPKLQTAMLDQGVLSGIRSAIGCMQIACGAISDGKMGPDTITHINSFVDLNYLLNRFKQEMISHYTKIALAQQKDQRFVRGWIARVMNLPA